MPENMKLHCLSFWLSYQCDYRVHACDDFIGNFMGNSRFIQQACVSQSSLFGLALKSKIQSTLVVAIRHAYDCCEMHHQSLSVWGRSFQIISSVQEKKNPIFLLPPQ